MFLRKIKDKAAAVSMIAVLIISVIVAPAVGYAANQVSEGLKDSGDDVKTSMPYQVLGPDYTKPQVINEGYTPEQVDTFVVPKPSINASPYVYQTFDYRTGLFLTINPNVFIDNAGEGMTIQARFYKESKPSQIYPVNITPGMTSQIYADEPGVYRVQISAVSRKTFSVNGGTVTKYSQPAIQHVIIEVKAASTFTSYGVSVPGTITTTNVGQIRAVMNQPISRIVKLELSLNTTGDSFAPTSHAGMYTSGDTAIVFVEGRWVAPYVYSSYKDVRYRITLQSAYDGSITEVIIPARIYKN